MTGRVNELSPAIPEPYRETIKRLTERVYKDAANNTSTLNLTASQVDDVLRDINKAIEQINAGLRDKAWSDAYSALVTLKEVVQNFSASLAMRRSSIGQYDTPWPGSRWQNG
jgi:hypothetical protein